MTVGLLATSCDWFKSKPEQPETVDVMDVTDSTLTTTDDSTAKKTDSAVAVVESKTETKKEVKK